GDQDEEFKRKFCHRVPLGRMATASDLSGPLLFLASQASSYVTGIELVENTSRKLGAWIQIRYTNGGEQELVANIIKLDDEVLMGRKKENTSELYRELLSYMNRWKNS
ncbi:MAG: hypothetical protein ACMUHY_08910, partial [Thermoplasmatota archaeon]